MKKKISFFDKIFSFRNSVIREYIESELSDYTDQIDLKKDLITKHWIFLIFRTIHIFIIIILLIYILSKMVKYYNLVMLEIQKGNQGINSLIIFLAIFIILGFTSSYSMKAKIKNQIGIWIGFIISIGSFFYLMPDKITLTFITQELFFTVFILFFIFLVEIILKCIKMIYDALVDYKDDFIVVYPEGLYISEKKGALFHSAQRIMFDEIVDVYSREKGLFGTILGYGKLQISIIGTGNNYEFRFCKNIAKVPTILNERRIEYAKSKKMKNKEISPNEISFNEEKEKKGIIIEDKPFKSRLRDDLIKILNLKK